MGTLSLSISFVPIADDGTDFTTPPDSAIIPFGSKGIQYNKDVTTSDGTLDLGGLTTPGTIRLRNRSSAVSIATPSAPTIAPQGIVGAATVNYKIVAVQAADPTGLPPLNTTSAAGVTALSNAILLDFATNKVTASAAPADGDTINVNGHIYTFKTTLTGAADEVHINGQDGSLTNLAAAINRTGTIGTDYGNGTVLNADVTASAVVVHVITLTAKLAETAGSSLTLAVTSATLTIGGALFSWNYNQVNWPVQTLIPDHYDIYRTSTTTTTPATTGKIGSVDGSVNTFNDTGMAGDGTTPPTLFGDNLILIGDLSADYPVRLKGGEINVIGWNAPAIHHKANSVTCRLEVTLLDN